MRYIKSAFIWLPAFIFLALVCISSYYLYEAGFSILAVLIIAIYFVNSIISIIIFIQRRNTTAKLSWFFVINVFPLLGHMTFLIFGQRYARRKEHKNYQSQKEFSYEQITSIDNKNIDGSIKSLFDKQSKMTNRGVYPANIDLYKHGEVALEIMFNNMEKAKKFIHVHFYIIKPGEIYEKFKSILIQKAREGVEIRFIIDDFGRWALPTFEVKKLQQEGIKIGIFGAVNYPFIGSENGYRSHRKMVIIDGETVHTGGLNIADEYASISPKYGKWLDFQTRITGKVVRSFSILFAQDWKLVTNIELDMNKYLLEKNGGRSHMIMIEDSPENVVPIIQDSIIQMILNAKKEIHLATPYFIPTPPLMSALRIAALSGVKIHLYIPGKPDKKSVLIASKYYANILQGFGVNIYEANDMLIHSKVALFDSKYTYFGSANLDIRSLYSQFELINLITGEDIQQVISLFKYYDTLVRLVKPNEFKVKGIKEKIMRIYVNLLSPIM